MLVKELNFIIETIEKNRHEVTMTSSEQIRQIFHYSKLSSKNEQSVTMNLK